MNYFCTAIYSKINHRKKSNAKVSIITLRWLNRTRMGLRNLVQIFLNLWIHWVAVVKCLRNISFNVAYICREKKWTNRSSLTYCPYFIIVLRHLFWLSFSNGSFKQAYSSRDYGGRRDTSSNEIRNF